MHDADFHLVERCKQADHCAFEDLIDRYKNKVYNYVCRMIDRPEDAEDITQEVFVRAYQSIDRFRGDSSFQTWIFRIATNLCVDYSRRAKRQVRTAWSVDDPLSEEEPDRCREIPDARRLPEQELQRRELQHQVRMALTKLSEKLRTVLVLYDIQGMSYEEISHTLNIPIGTVKSRLFNARAELGKRLQDYVCG